MHHCFRQFTQVQRLFEKLVEQALIDQPVDAVAYTRAASDVARWFDSSAAFRRYMLNFLQTQEELELGAG